MRYCSIFYVFRTLDLLLFVGTMILQLMMQNFWEEELSRANEDLTCYAWCIWKKKKSKRHETWDTIHWLISSIMWRGRVSQDWQRLTLIRSGKSKQNRIDNHPELKAAISCPFRAQGVGAQLPAFPTVLDSTLAALRLPSGHEPVTPHHNETTCQCSLSDSCKSRSQRTKLNI